MRLRKLDRAFYLRSTKKVARELLGKYLVRRIDRKKLIGRIVEVEAYLGEIDPASHAYRGRTKRNDVMFWEGGHLYVYFTYGMHFCCNVVTEKKGRGRAVLLRAVEPVTEIEMMSRRRNHRTTFPLKREDLCNGPAKLCQAIDVDRTDNGTDLCGGRIWIAENLNASDRVRVGVSTRIGIADGRNLNLRYYVKGNRFVSNGKPVA